MLNVAEQIDRLHIAFCSIPVSFNNRSQNDKRRFFSCIYSYLRLSVLVALRLYCLLKIEKERS